MDQVTKFIKRTQTVPHRVHYIHDERPGKEHAPPLALVYPDEGVRIDYTKPRNQQLVGE